MNPTEDKPSVFMKPAVLGVFIIVFSGSVYGQVDSAVSTRASGFSVGVVAGLGQAVYAGIVGLEATSPAFLENRLAVRLHGGLNWIETFDSQGYQINKHPSLGASIVYRSLVSRRARFYIEIGTFVLFPSQDLPDHAYATSYSGTTGFEFFSRPRSGVMLSYFFGGGLAIRGTDFSESGNQEDYGEDFIFTNGLRVYF